MGGAPYESTPPAIDMIRGLSPLANHIMKLSLIGWKVTAEVIKAISTALPELHSINLDFCTLDSGAWRELLTMTAFTHLKLDGTPCSLLQVTSFAASVRRGMTLAINSRCMIASERTAFKDFIPVLNAQRDHMHLPPIFFVGF